MTKNKRPVVDLDGEIETIQKDLKVACIYAEDGAPRSSARNLLHAAARLTKLADDMNEFAIWKDTEMARLRK